MVLVAVVFAFLIAGVRIFGIQVFGVLTGSMEPSYPTGSLIYVKDVEPQELKLGDPVTFYLAGTTIAFESTCSAGKEIHREKPFALLLRKGKRLWKRQ